jgi:hypothetical protein
VRAWQRVEPGATVTAKPKTTNELLGWFVHSFQLKPKFWQAIGRRRARVCQFSLSGATPEHWYVALDEAGGVVHSGNHPSPDATWISEAASLLSIMRLEIEGRDLVREGKIRLSGNLDLLHELLSALEG